MASDELPADGDPWVNVPPRLRRACQGDGARADWLDRLPTVVGQLAHRWSLVVHAPFPDAGAAWVARTARGDGTTAVLKIAMPHSEGRDEIAGLRFWNGDPTVRVLAADDDLGAMLLEDCVPGVALDTVPEADQDLVIADRLKRIWKAPPAQGPFRPLASMLTEWCAESRRQEDKWPDAGLVRAGLAAFDDLVATTTTELLLATDLHAGNVLSGQRVPWLVIDPKPFVGDTAYDATQHLLNCRTRVMADPDGTVGRFADLLGVDAGRVRRWLFARLAAAPRDNWHDDDAMQLAMTLD